MMQQLAQPTRLFFWSSSTLETRWEALWLHHSVQTHSHSGIPSVLVHFTGKLPSDLFPVCRCLEKLFARTCWNWLSVPPVLPYEPVALIITVSILANMIVFVYVFNNSVHLNTSWTKLSGLELSLSRWRTRSIRFWTSLSAAVWTLVHSK